MKKFFVLVPALFSVAGSTAQVWCPPGATWHHGWFTFTETGYVTTVYGADTLINGTPSQKLLPEKHIYDFVSQSYVDQALPALFTAVDQDMVSIWTGSDFDTLYRLNAIPGDSWQVPLTFDPVNLLVNDTGTIVVDGLSLRYLAVEYSPGGFQDTIVERTGSWRVFFDASLSLGLDAPISRLRCYEDQDISYSSGAAPTCDFVLAIGSGMEVWSVRPYPNPGTEQVSVVLAQGGTLDISDAFGRLMATWPMQPGQNTISTVGWSPGHYSFLLRSGAQLKSFSWIKI